MCPPNINVQLDLVDFPVKVGIFSPNFEFISWLTSEHAKTFESVGVVGAIGVTCWEFKPHLFKALVLSSFTYGIQVWGGNLKISQWKVFEKGIKIHVMSHLKVHSSTPYHILLAKFEEPAMELYALKLTIGFQQWDTIPTYPCLG